MTIYEIVEQKLKDHPFFRERKTRSKFLAILTLRDLELEGKHLDMEELAKFAVKYASYERAWRQVLEKNEAMRGLDYLPDKDILEQEKIKELGY
jgi:hypothetical protein